VNSGKGFVIAVGSPWFENQSLDFTASGLTNDNRLVAANFAHWLLSAAADNSAGK
jgi:hypothetical protein